MLAPLPPAASRSSRRSSRTCCASSPLVAQGRGDEAWRAVSGMQTPAAPPAAARYYETRQQVAIATGHLLDGIRSELARERLIAPGDARIARSELLAPVARRGRTRRLARAAARQRRHRAWLARGRFGRARQRAQPDARRHAAGRVPRALSRRIRRSPRSSDEPGIGIEGPPASLEAAPHVALMLPLTGRTSAPRGADPRRLHDRLLPAAGRNAAAPAGLRHRRRLDRRHHRRRPPRPVPNSSSAR